MALPRTPHPLLAGVFLAALAHGQTAFRYPVALPESWEVLEQRPQEATPPLPQTLLRAQRPDGSATIVLYQTGEAPPPNIDRVQEDSLFMTVLGRGMTVAKKANRHPEAAPCSGTVEVGTEDGTTFTLTTLTTPRGSLRLLTTHPASHPDAAREIDAIIRSFRQSRAADPSPEPSSRPDGRESSEGNRLVTENRGALLLFEGNHGTSAGFLCRQDGKHYAFVNPRTIARNTGFRIVSLTGRKVPIADCALATGRDLARLNLAQPPEAVFEAAADLDREVKPGDTVFVLGLPEGSQTMAARSAQITAIGLDRLELDNRSGLGGGPVIHAASGKVIGIAVSEPAPSGNGETLYRIDRIRHWEPLVWSRFYQQAAQLEAIEKVTADLLSLAAANGTLRLADCRSSEIRGPVETFLDSLQRAGTPAGRDAALQRLVGEIRSVSRNDLRAFNTPLAYDYFRRATEKQRQQREAVMEKLVRSLQTILQPAE